MKQLLSKPVIVAIVFTFLLISNFYSFAQAPNWQWAKHIVPSTNSSASTSLQKIVIDSFGNSYIIGTFATSSIVVGNITVTNSSNSDEIFLAKFDVNGNVLWAKRVEGAGSDAAYGLAVDGNGNLYVTGSFASTYVSFGNNVVLWNSTNSNYMAVADMFIVKYDTNGNALWARKSSSTNSGAERGVDVEIDGLGNVYVIGVFTDQATFGNIALYATNGSNIFIVKYNSIGNVLWAKSVGGASTFGTDLELDTSGYIYIYGTFTSPTITFGNISFTNTSLPPYTQDAFLAKYDVDGNVQWVRGIGGNSNESAHQIKFDRSRNCLLVTGTFEGSSVIIGNFTVTATNTTPGQFGSAFWAEYALDGSVLRAKEEKTNGYIAIDGSGNIYLSGSFSSPTITFGNFVLTNTTPNFSDIFIVKYNANWGVIWAKGVGGANADNSLTNAVDITGSLYILGTFSSPSIVFGNSVLTNSNYNSGNSTYKDMFIAKLGATDLTCVNANITQNDTTICRGSSITLSIDSLLAGMNACNSAQLSTNLQNGLVAYYPFCGNANDASGNGNNGNFVGSSTLTTDRFGNNNKAFQAGTSYVTCPSTVFQFGRNDNFSFSVWFTKSTNNGGRMISTENPEGNFRISGDGNLNFSVQFGDYLNFSINDNNWHNLIYTYSSRNEKVYIDGLLSISNFDNSNEGLNYGSPFTIGAKAAPSYDKWNGKIDDVGIWNRALTAAEVQQLYQNSSVVWSTGATTNQITVSPTQNTTYYATVTNGITTCIDSIRVTMSQVDTSLTLLDPAQVCTNSGQVRMQAGVAATYQWLRNSIAISGATTRNYTATQTGFYRVALANTLGCRDTSRAIQVTLNPQPVPSFTINNNIQCFNGNSFSFSNTSTISSGTMQHSWNFGDGVGVSTLANPVYSYTSPGTYTVTLTTTSQLNCIAIYTVQVIVRPSPTGSITVPATTIICDGSFVTLTATGGNTYQWYLNGQIIVGATSSTHNATQAGSYTAQLINNFSCAAMASNTITLTKLFKPTANFVFDKYCAGFTTTFTNQSNISSSGTVTYSWALGDGGVSTLQHPTHIYLLAGNYSAQLTVTPVTCPSLFESVTKTISVQAKPADVRYTSLNALANKNLQLQARDFIGATYLWIPSTGLNNSIIKSPIFNYNSAQQYLINITNAAGCLIKDSLLVRMFSKSEIYLPETFTPNGDGKNDKLTPLLVGIVELKYFKVFNRWGQLLFTTSQIGDGWDGTFKGTKQPLETYTWMVEGKDLDGNSIQRIGSTVLQR